MTLSVAPRVTPYDVGNGRFRWTLDVDADSAERVHRDYAHDRVAGGTDDDEPTSLIVNVDRGQIAGSIAISAKLNDASGQVRFDFDPNALSTESPSSLKDDGKTTRATGSRTRRPSTLVVYQRYVMNIADDNDRLRAMTRTRGAERAGMLAHDSTTPCDGPDEQSCATRMTMYAAGTIVVTLQGSGRAGHCPRSPSSSRRRRPDQGLCHHFRDRQDA